MASALNPMYKPAFRKLLKSAKYVFGKDVAMIEVAREQIRLEFLKHRHVTDPDALKECYFNVDDADTMLRFHLVQGVRNEKSGNFDVKFTENNQEAIQQAQDLPLGPEVTVIDRSFVGQGVTINKSGGKHSQTSEKPSEKVESIKKEECTDASHKH